MATLTINPADADVHLSEAAPNTNLESTELETGPQPTLRWRSILKFDFSALPTDAVITAATLYLYYYASNPPDPVGRTLDACELTQTGWVEAEATWNSYKTGSTWAAAGGDFTATDKASAVVPASVGAYMSWNVLALCQHFQSTHSEVAHFLIKDSAESGINNYIPVFYSRTNGNANKPYLEIIYTVPVDYVLTTSVGEITLSGVNVLMVRPIITMLTSVGSTTLSGVNAVLKFSIKQFAKIFNQKIIGKIKDFNIKTGIKSNKPK
jgi:hypothetical protein